MNITINTKLKLLNDSITKGIASKKSASKLPLWCLGLALPLLSVTALAAQEQDVDAKEVETKQLAKKQGEVNKAETEVITVEGYQNVIKESIAAKRFETVIVDAISTEDIGNLPATSLADVIETITGAGITRAKGSGTEVSLRGLGPKLGATRFNGRDASNGTGNRTVNFSQFPSELVNSIKIYKSQRADLVEGGIAGVVEIGSVRPLDYGKQRIQLAYKGSYSPGADNMENADPYGNKITASYVDQFDLGEMGDFGLTFGLQRYEVSNPQDRMNGSSAWSACDATVTPELDSRGRYPRCTGDLIDLDGENRNNPFYLATNSYAAVQQGEEDTRDALFTTMQWIPNHELQFNLDLQYSEREYTEDRHQLVFEDMRRIGPDPVFSDTGALESFTGTSLISVQDRYYNRQEEYKGIGFEVEWDASDRLTLTADLSYSGTSRLDLDRRARLRSDGLDIYGNDTPLKDAFPGTDGNVPYTFEHTGDVPSFYIDPSVFDVTDHTLFSDDLALRRDSTIKENEISAFTFDTVYEVDGEWLSQVKAGVRLSSMTYEQQGITTRHVQPGSQAEKRVEDARVNETCRIDFPQDDFLDGASGAEITSWAAFDTVCLFNEYTGSEFGERVTLDNPAIDIEEDTYAAYIMADFDTEIGGMPLSGNFGARFIQTNITSVGARADYTIEPVGDTGNIELIPTGESTTVVFENDEFDVLPSVNVSLELQDDLVLRGAVYRAMSRPDPSKLGAGRIFSINSEEGGFETVEEAIANVRAAGNPRIKPLRAWNADLSLEWYANDETILAAALYHKQFEGGTIPVVEDETFTIDGQTVTVPVSVNQSTDEKSKLTGIELSVSHVFSYLPEPFNGLGVKVGYNYADTDYEVQDIKLGDQIIKGEFYEGIVKPAHLSGFSDTVASAQLFYKIGGLQLQGIYKYRSAYHFDFLAGNNQLRIIDDSTVFDARISYRLSKNIRLTFEGRNLTNEPVVHDMPVVGSQRDYQSYGPTYYAGIRVNF